jgi:hypothetical protein
VIAISTGAKKLQLESAPYVRPIRFDATSGRLALSIGLIATVYGGSARAQSIEPRSYSPAPVGMNFAIVAFTDSEGGLSTDPAIPFKDADLSLQTVVLAYARSLDLWGASGKIDAIIPYGKLSGSAVYQGDRVERRVDGFADPLVRISAILSGAPALSPAAFRTYRQDFLVAASVQVSIPVGQYDGTRLLNIGANRWSAKPEIGISKVLGRWTLEAAAAATFYETNRNFYGGAKRSQEPIYSARAHLIYSLRSGAWVALDATHFTGGETRVNDADDRDLQRNWRVGVTAAVPISRSFSIKFNASKGVSARTGNNYDLFGVALQYRWADR